MAFCEKCGKEIGPDGVCDCQKTQGEVPRTEEAPKAETPGAGAVPKKLQDMLKDKKIVMIAAAVAAAVVLLIIIGVVAAGSGSYKTPVNELVKLINKQSTDVFAYMELEDPANTDYLRNIYSVLKKNEDLKEGFEDKKEKLADFYGDIKGFKIKCDFVKAEEMKGKDLRAIKEAKFDSDLYEDMLEELADMDKGDYEDLAEGFGVSVGDAKKIVKQTIAYFKSLGKADVSKGYVVTVRIYAKYDGEEDKTEKLEDIQIIKVDGKWRIYNMSSLFRKMRFNDDLSDISLYNIYRAIGSVDFGF